MLPLLLIVTVFVAKAQAQLCVSCADIRCVNGTCEDDENMCAHCTGVILPLTDKGGACVEQCYIGLYQDLEFSSCPEGYECRSNGCGHTCQKITTKVEERLMVGICVEECSIDPVKIALGFGTCPLGYECLFNGCGYTCHEVTGEITDGLCVITCDMGISPDMNSFPTCEEGYECKFNGCGHTCKKIEYKPVIGECDDLCTPECPEGYACLSNGIGYSCQPVQA